MYLLAALEASFYLSPKAPGLTYDELLEAGGRLKLRPGEIRDCLQNVSPTYKAGRLLPDTNKIGSWLIPHHVQEPDFRNVAAFDFWFAALKESGRENGPQNARVDREVTIERAVALGISRKDMEVALAVETHQNNLIDKDGVVSCSAGRLTWKLLTEQRRENPGRIRRNEALAAAYPMVKDLIERRSDGRPTHIQPFDAFAEKLESLGYRHMQMWWRQMVSELKRTDTETSPVAFSVFAEALVEGALTFVVKHGRSLNHGVFGSSDFDGDAQKWNMRDLVKSAAASGHEAAVLDQLNRVRAENLIAARRRINAGRMLSDFPGGVPDYRPEQAREAKTSAENVVRQVLDWLEKYPVETTAN